MDELKCPVCNRLFDGSRRLPLLFPTCRHISCRTCVQRQVAEAARRGTSQVKCAQCPQNVFCDARDGLDSVFPPNPEALALLQADKLDVECIHWQDERNLVCFDPGCEVKNRFCRMCQAAFHRQCDQSLIFEEGLACRKLLAPQLSLPGSLPMANLRKELKFGLKALEDTLGSMLTQADLLFQTEVDESLRSSGSPAAVMAHKERFRFSVDSEGMLVPRLRNDEALQEFAASVTRFFSGEFFRRVNDLRNAFWADRLPLFQHFIQPDLKNFQPVFQHFEGANKRLVSEVVLADGPSEVPASLPNYLRAVEARLARAELGLKLAPGFGGSSAEEAVFRKLVDAAFFDGAANWDGVFNHLKESLEDYALREGLKGSPHEEFWDLKLTLGEPLEGGPDSRVVRLGRGDFLVSFHPLEGAGSG